MAIISTGAAQNPFEAAASSLQEQMNTAGQQLQEKAVQHVLEGNLSQEHIAQDLNAGKENLTAQARAKVNQMNLNLTSEQLQQKAAEELKKQVNEQIQKQPGFGTALAMLATLAAAGLIRRRN
ncbi:MAG: PGF-CTERM sorting domain-containing protein [Methanothrix sp.]